MSSTASATATGMRVVQFYSKSADDDDISLGVPSWRKVLSNFHPVVIEVQGKRYPSVEHAFHAAKARCSDKPALAREFEVGGAVAAAPLAARPEQNPRPALCDAHS